jgi:hypothetical protein
VAFEVFKRERVPSSTDPTVTIQKTGRLSLNKAAFVQLGHPKFVELLYDRDQRLIGLRKVSKSIHHGYPVRPVSAKATSWVISGKAFLDFYDITMDATRRSIAQIQGQMLVVDLKRPGEKVGRGRVEGGWD